MEMGFRIYLAGPDVFSGKSFELGEKKKEICARHGLVGLYPTDVIKYDRPLTRYEQGLYAYDAMETAMNACDAAIVNMTPYHGPSMDAGSAFEMGYMRAQHKPIFAYSNDGRLFAERVVGFWDGEIEIRDSGDREDPLGMQVEEHDMIDNLMMASAVARSSGVLVSGHVAPADLYASLEYFERCVKLAAEWFKNNK